MRPDGITAVAVPDAVAATLCTELPRPVSTARASTAPLTGFSAPGMKFSM